MSGAVPGPDGVLRCPWGAGSAADYLIYHDEEWGRPVRGDTALFERLSLEAFQSGLSWLTILRKRENFRAAFADFDLETVAAYDEGDVVQLLGDAGIVRHRGKIQSTINNAGRALALQQEFGSLCAYVSQYRPARTTRLTIDGELFATCPESIAMSKDLKKRGWSFVGPTTMYAFMQAMGMVNDHIEGCEREP